MAKTTKEMSKLDFEQVLKGQYADEIASSATTGFVQLKVGHAVEIVSTGSTSDNANYYDGSTLVMTLSLTYSDSSKSSIVRAERTV